MIKRHPPLMIIGGYSCVIPINRRPTPQALNNCYRTKPVATSHCILSLSPSLSPSSSTSSNTRVFFSLFHSLGNCVKSACGSGGPLKGKIFSFSYSSFTTEQIKPASLDVPHKMTPATPRTARKLKTPGSDSDPLSSPNPASKSPKDRSSKVVDRRSPRTPGSEKKRPNRVSELESQLAQLQEELSKSKDQLNSSESWKRRAQQEAEEAKKQLAAMSSKLEETEKQLVELSDSEDSRIHELRKISQDRDRAWQSELEAVQKQHEMDSAALASAMHEIQRLKMQLDRVAEAEDAQARRAESAHAEVQNLRMELENTLEFVEKLKSQLSNTKESEAQALEELTRAQMQLEVVKTTEETVRSELVNAVESYKSLVFELEQSKNRVNSLEELVGKLRADLDNSNNITDPPSNDNIPSVDGECNESELLKTEVTNLKLEASQLKAALEAAERRYQEEYIRSTLQIRSAYELVERAKSDSSAREAELETKLKVSRADIEELKAKLIEKENALQSISFEKRGPNLKMEEDQPTERETELEIELKKSESVLADMKASLLDKETQLQSIAEENEMLKSEIMKTKVERSKANDEALVVAEEACAAEREALLKLGYLTEEADKSSRKAARVAEQLNAAQVANSEMEAELRRLKVQADQWRKAAEAAAAMLSTGNNGKYVERTGSLDYHTIGGKLGLPYSEDMEDDSPKKKNGNMLKKFGVLLKKSQK
ncbi:Interactor of constitutive active ROPs 2 [Abeliophyllum distichum]|uniref:Interactor of constitutive active ROPs 2 n=1 Tax=Abeliophyllum distichum TaxID=126358 RepID=A0ABD1RA23_9LAMI